LNQPSPKYHHAVGFHPTAFEAGAPDKDLPSP
jgi:hypothetical protein